MKYALALIVLLSIITCNEKSRFSSPSDKSQQEEYVAPQREKKLINTVTVFAEVFHYINNYDGTGTDKDANRSKRITLYLYDDGSAFLQDGDMIGGVVRYSKKPGYEYECNTGNETYAFNYDLDAAFEKPSSQGRYQVVTKDLGHKTLPSGEEADAISVDTLYY